MLCYVPSPGGCFFCDKVLIRGIGTQKIGFILDSRVSYGVLLLELVVIHPTSNGKDSLRVLGM